MARRMTALAFLVWLLAVTGCFSGRSQGMGVITGYVYDDVSGEGIPGADVVLAPSNASMKTRADGAFQFENVADGTYTIRVTAPGYQNATQTGVQVSSGKVKWAKLFLKRPSRGDGG